MGTFTKGAPLSKADISDTGNPFILYGELYTTYPEITTSIVRKTLKTATTECLSRVGDVIIPTSGETPEEIATATCVMLSNVILAGDLNIYRNSTVDGRFISYIINHVVNGDISRIAQGKSVVHIKADELSKIVIHYPERAEQQKIIDFLYLLDTKIAKQRQMIDMLKSYKRGVINRIVGEFEACEWLPIKDLIENGIINLKRGNVIPKFKYSEQYIYPVYSSSTHNNGLLGFYNTYMFDEELITWSIDGGGDFFYRPKHKFNVTNVCGVLRLDTTKFDYMFCYEILNWQHSKMVFDYQTKAHPSVIEDLYKLPIVSYDKQCALSTTLHKFNCLIDREIKALSQMKNLKKCLLQRLFI